MALTISIIVPALNEEAHIADAVRETTEAVRTRFDDYEILLFDDGNTDRTGAIMDALAREDPHLRVTHNPTPKNLGGVYKQGVAMARHEYVVMIPGDNENPASALDAPFGALGQAEIIVPFTDQGQRSRPREIVSRSYVGVMNTLFGLNLRYYNGTVIHRTENVRNLRIDTDSFAYQSEALVKLLRAGKSYVEVKVAVQPRTGRSSKAFHLKNVYGVLSAIARLAKDVHLDRRGEAS